MGVVLDPIDFYCVVKKHSSKYLLSTDLERHGSESMTEFSFLCKISFQCTCTA